MGSYFSLFKSNRSLGSEITHINSYVCIVYIFIYAMVKRSVWLGINSERKNKCISQVNYASLTNNKYYHAKFLHFN